jgi:RNA polymerase sigma-70 factor (ECF subfamily)
VVARRRLVDHWRRQEREDRSYRLADVVAVDADPEWDAELDVRAVLAALEHVGAHHRAALTLRYLDGLAVAQVACELGRGLHATEALLQRARRALRRAYEEVRADA